MRSDIELQPCACVMIDVDVWLQEVLRSIFTRQDFVTRPVAALLYYVLANRGGNRVSWDS
jgi:hypothetical protein